MEQQTHTCTKCGEEKPLTTEFFYRRNTKFGWRKDCKICMKHRCNKYYNENKEHLMIMTKQYYYDNHEKNKKKQREYRIKNWLTLKSKQIEYVVNRKKTDSLYKLKRNLLLKKLKMKDQPLFQMQ